MKRRTIAVGVGAVFALGLGAIWAFQRPIGTALFTRAVDGRIGRDATATLPDGLHIVLCGTGSPLPDPTRGEPCALVIAGKRLFVVDAGDGAGRRIAGLGLPVGRIERVFLTHFHSDHIDGLGQLALLRWTGGSATAPLPVAGPPGVESVVAGFNAAYAADFTYRTAHHGPAIAPPGGAGTIAQPFALADAVTVLDDGGVRVTAFRVNHAPVAPAVGYRFDYGGRSIVISGDTAPTPNIARVARGADLLVHEALQPALVARMTDRLAARGQANTAQITRDILSYHTTPEAAADAAKAAGVRSLILTHIVPPLPTRYLNAAFLGDARAHFSGPITVGEDGMIFTLPAKTTDIGQSKLR